MDSVAEQVAERAIDRALALDAAHPDEGRRFDVHGEMALALPSSPA